MDVQHLHRLRQHHKTSGGVLALGDGFEGDETDAEETVDPARQQGVEIVQRAGLTDDQMREGGVVQQGRDLRPMARVAVDPDAEAALQGGAQGLDPAPGDPLHGGGEEQQVGALAIGDGQQDGARGGAGGDLGQGEIDGPARQPLILVGAFGGDHHEADANAGADRVQQAQVEAAAGFGRDAGRVEQAGFVGGPGAEHQRAVVCGLSGRGLGPQDNQHQADGEPAKDVHGWDRPVRVSLSGREYWPGGQSAAMAQPARTRLHMPMPSA